MSLTRTARHVGSKILNQAAGHPVVKACCSAALPAADTGLRVERSFTFLEA